MHNHVISSRILDWVKRYTQPNAMISYVTKLKGSTSSILHRITLEQEGSFYDVVVRQFDNEEWLLEEPDLAVHEAASLRKARASSVTTPHIIAFDKTGMECGVPTVLMSYLKGDVELLPNSQQKWLHGLANTLVAIHQVEATNFPYQYNIYQDIQSFNVPTWSSVPHTWKKAIEYVQGPRPAYEPHFIHRDFHPTNVLWDNAAVSGVVDWVNACTGPIGVDVGHCRVNLAQLYDVETADAFLASYTSLASHFKYEPYWDIVSLIDILFGPPKVYPGWRAFGVTGLTNDMMMKRLDKYVVSLVKRI